jgi:hypothetical protein
MVIGDNKRAHEGQEKTAGRPAEKQAMNPMAGDF